MDILFALFVPIRLGHPAAEGVGEVDFALACDDPVGKEWEAALEKTFEHLWDGAAGIDAPDDVLFFAEFADDFKKCVGHGRVFRGVMECAVEVEGEDGGGAATWRIKWFHES